MGRCSASTISPSVTVSHRQMTRPYSGFSLISAAFSLAESRWNTVRRRVSIKSFFASVCSPQPRRSYTAISPMAGAPESPGERMPARLIKPGACRDSSMMKSSCWV